MDHRRAILDASIALVAERGVRDVSFREVARRAGVSHQTPYHHFESHHGILLAIAKEGFMSLTHAMSDAASAKTDPLQALVASGVAYVLFARDHVGHFRVMFQHRRDRETDLPEAVATHATLVRLASAAHAAGYAASVSASDLAHLAWAIVHGIATLEVEGLLADQPVSARKKDIATKVVHAFAKLVAK